MTYQQLIKKLRWGWRFVEGQDISNRDLEQAATSIEELMKERDDLGRKLNTARYGQPDFAWSIHEEAMADLRAKLAKAMEALRFYAPQTVGGITFVGGDDAGKRAAAALTELEGE
jgi:hypothetical protein